MRKPAIPSPKVARRPKKPRGKGPVRLNYNLPGDLVQRLDRHAAKLAADDPLGRPVTRTDVIRLLLIDALDRAGTK
jgi:hypothetical protein